MKTIQLYEYKELNTVAATNARERVYQKWIDTDDEWDRWCLEDIDAMLKAIGVDLHPYDQRTCRPAVHPQIMYQLYGQGAGACFEAVYSYAPGWKARLKRDFPGEETIMELAERLRQAQIPFRNRAVIKIRQMSHRYFHHGTMNFTGTVGEKMLRWPEIEPFALVLKDIARYIFKLLREEKEGQQSSDFIEQWIEGRDNLYFFADGSICPKEIAEGLENV